MPVVETILKDTIIDVLEDLDGSKVFQISPNVTLEVNVDVTAGENKIFDIQFDSSDRGKVRFGLAGPGVVLPQWFGAFPDSTSTTNQTETLQDALLFGKRPTMRSSASKREIHLQETLRSLAIRLIYQRYLSKNERRITGRLVELSWTTG